jgi:hypothetical protein
MFNKVLSGILFTCFIGILIWGGVNRTLAKTNGNENNVSQQEISNKNTKGVQPRGNHNLDEDVHKEECDEDHSSGNTFLEYKGNGNRGGQGNARNKGQGGGSDPLTATEIEALNLALDDEYHAFAVYASVIDTFGEVEPFVEILSSEQRHINALTNQLVKLGVQVPANRWIGTIQTFDSLKKACQAAVTAEVANANLYDQLFNMTDDPNLTRVFTNLRNASLNSHLPKFQECQ